MIYIIIGSFKSQCTYMPENTRTESLKIQPVSGELLKRGKTEQHLEVMTFLLTGIMESDLTNSCKPFI